MRKIHYKKSHEEPLINLTPLIDVVFVILFTFIVVAPLLETDKVALASSGKESTKQNVNEKAEVIIHVFADNTISLNRQKISLDNLAQHLSQIKKNSSEKKAQVFHDKSASFGTYQAVKNALESSGYQEMDVILEPG